ncbi:MAG: hypothetical protein JST19_17550 [Bacteroidetes bacterium]|nr:hypothetical protein [Bacteroidota bacterium]
MKTWSLILMTVLLVVSASLKAQKKAQPDNGMIAVVQTQTTLGKTQQTHYKMTNNNSVSMDFALYRQMNNGSWDVMKHLDLQPGQTYEDISDFTGYNGKYVLYSAAHSDWASFPNTADIGGLVNGAAASPPVPITPPATTPSPNH